MLCSAVRWVLSGESLMLLFPPMKLVRRLVRLQTTTITSHTTLPSNSLASHCFVAMPLGSQATRACGCCLQLLALPTRKQLVHFPNFFFRWFQQDCIAALHIFGRKSSACGLHPVLTMTVPPHLVAIAASNISSTAGTITGQVD